MAAPEAEADPSGGYGIAAAGACTTVTETVLTKACATGYTKRCSQSAKTKYNTEYDTIATHERYQRRHQCQTNHQQSQFQNPSEAPYEFYYISTVDNDARVTYSSG